MVGVNRIKWAKFAVVAVALVAGCVLVLGDLWVTPDDLPPGRPRAAQHALAVFVICIALWLTNLIPLAATGLLAIGLLPILNILPRDQAFGLFGNSAVFFILGVFLLAAAMIATGLSKRLTLLFLQRFDRTPGNLVTGVLFTSAFLALWMPEHAVCAMIFPILLEIADTLKLKKGESEYGKKLFLSLAWGSIIGGVATILGGARAPLALGLLNEFYGLQISFLQWMAAGVPIALLLVVAAWILLNRSFKDDISSIQPATRMLDERVRRLGPMSGREGRLAFLGASTVVAWIVLGHDVGLGVISLMSATGIFILRIADWRELQDFVNWGVLIMYGGAVALGSALSETHAFTWIVTRFFDGSASPFVILALVVTVAMVLTEGVSNSAAVAIVLPIGFSFCDAVPGLDPVTMTLAVTIPAGLAFCLPISSPPNAICFSAGYYEVRDVVAKGVTMNIIALVVVLLTARFYWGWLGFGES